MMFDPFLLDESITPDSVKKTLKSQDWGKGTETVVNFSRNWRPNFYLCSVDDVGEIEREATHPGGSRRNPTH
jgi:hypothetical protein